MAAKISRFRSSTRRLLRRLLGLIISVTAWHYEGKIEIKIKSIQQRDDWRVNPVSINSNSMRSFRDAREMLLLCFDQNIIDEEEFVLLYDANTSQNLAFPYYENNRFSFDSKYGAEYIADFRVQKADIPQLADALRVPNIFRCSNGTVCDGLEGLCMLMKRFAYPCRYSDIIPIFGRAVPELICNEVTDWIFDHHSHRITMWNQLLPTSLQTYANAINNKGAMATNAYIH